jgi:hypothetical protein
MESHRLKEWIHESAVSLLAFLAGLVAGIMITSSFDPRQIYANPLVVVLILFGPGLLSAGVYILLHGRFHKSALFIVDTVLIVTVYWYFLFLFGYDYTKPMPASTPLLGILLIWGTFMAFSSLWTRTNIDEGLIASKYFYAGVACGVLCGSLLCIVPAFVLWQLSIFNT